MDLVLSLLGPFHVTLDGQPVRFATHSARALLGYLAAQPERPHRREVLADLLWPDRPEAIARHSLSQTLLRLRQAIHDQDATLPFLHITPQTVQFNAAPAVIDVAHFEALLAACQAHSHPSLGTCAPCLDRLRRAVALYRGDFLQDLFVKGAQPFNEWTLFEREHRHRQVLDLLETLIRHATAAADYEQARRYAERQLAMEPWYEEGHRHLIAALAALGQRSAALAQYETCRRLLGAELGVEPSAETTALYERIRTSGSAPATRTSPPHSLPTPLTPFIGRERELAELDARLQDPAVRLLTLVGVGGMGKTRLALEVARLSRDRFSDGCHFVPLTPLADAAAMIPTIAATLDLTLPGGDPRTALLRALRDKKALLILDSFEHLLTGRGLVVDLLQAAPEVRVMVTSRVRLNLAGEYVHTVAPMDYPAYADVAAAAPSSAVRLFVQSTRRCLPGFKLDETNVGDVVKICRLVGGMPLGLELAAVWTEMLTLAEIAAEIERSADFLASDSPVVEPRQQSLRAVFDGSWRLLSDPERETLRRLAVFHGGFTRAAAETVVAASLRVLTQLVHKSLLRWAWGPDGAGRYEMHELVREFAAQRLAAFPPEQAAVEAQHSAFYLDFVAEHERRLDRDEPKEAVQAIQTEVDNVRQAWEWAVAHLHAALVDRSAYSLWQFYFVAGLWAEGERALRRASERWREALSAAAGDGSAPAESLALLSKLLGTHAYALHIGGHHERVLAVAQEALTWAEASYSVEGTILGEMLGGIALLQTGSHLEARPRLKRALALSRSHHLDYPGEMLWDAEWGCHLFLGLIALMSGDPGSARSALTEALHLCQRLGKRRGEVTCLYNLGNVACHVRDYASARLYCEQALRLVPTVGYTWGAGMVQLYLGEAVRMQGEYGLADELLNRAVTILGAIDAVEAFKGRASLGRLHLCLGDYRGAQRWLDELAKGMDRVESVEVQSYAFLTRAWLALHLDDPTARVYTEQAWQIDRKMGSGYSQAATLLVMGHMEAALGRWAAARLAYQQALMLCERLDTPTLAAEGHAGLARVAVAEGNEALALAHAEAMLGIVAECPRVGLDEPFMVYLTCYQVLAAAHDPRADQVLRAGHTLLQTYAGHITDVVLRRSFLENVPVHWALHTAYRKRLAQPSQARLASRHPRPPRTLLAHHQRPPICLREAPVKRPPVARGSSAGARRMGLPNRYRTDSHETTMAERR